jgi:hypothetical protein
MLLTQAKEEAEECSPSYVLWSTYVLKCRVKPKVLGFIKIGAYLRWSQVQA